MDYGSIVKKRAANPNRRSASYSWQSRFEGSDRQIRGRLLALVLAEGGGPGRCRPRPGEEDPRRPRPGGIRRGERGDVYLPVRA